MSQTALQDIEQLEDSLWAAADNLRANSKLTSSEYCLPVLGVIFLRHATNRYDAASRQIAEEQAAGKMPKRPLVKQDFIKRRALMLPKEARYDELLKLPKGANLGAALEETFAKLVELAKSLDAEQRRAAEEGLSEDELALFDLLKKDNLSKTDRERVKRVSRSLLESVRKLIAPLERWTEKEQTQAEVEVGILDHVFEALPTPPFTADEKQAVAKRVYQHVWQQSTAGTMAAAFPA